MPADLWRPQAALLLTPGPMMVPFRYSRGAISKYAANKEGCRLNLPGLKRHKDETIYGKNWFNEAARRAIVLSLPKNHWILNI